MHATGLWAGTFQWCNIRTSMPNNNLPYRHHAVFEGLLNSKGLPDPTTRELTPEQKRRR